MQPLVHEKLDEFLEQGIILAVEEHSDLVSSLAYTWKANGKLKSLFRSKRYQQSDQKGSLQDPNSRRDHPPAGRKQKVHQGQWNFIILLHSPRL